MFQKTTIYHSTLVSEGEIEALLNSEPCKSKFPAKDGSVQYYVEMIIAGTKHQLILENDSCRSALTGYKGQTVTIRASGSRDNATLDVDGIRVGTEQQAAPAQRQAPAQRAAGPPQQQAELPAQQPTPQQRQTAAPTIDINSARLSIMQITNLHLLCAQYVAQYEVPSLKKATGEDMSESQRQGATASIFIESCKSGLCRMMPSHPLKD